MFPFYKHVPPLTPGLRLRRLVLLSAFQARGCADQTGTRRRILPVYGEHHLLYTRLNLVLCFQVSHVLRRFAIDSQDHVSDTQIGLGSFTPGGDLELKRI